jgi:hypothetical protein
MMLVGYWAYLLIEIRNTPLEAVECFSADNLEVFIDRGYEHPCYERHVIGQ